MKSKRKRKNKKPFPSFVETMMEGLRDDPAMRPILDFLEGYNSEINHQFDVYVESEPQIQLQIPPEMYRKLLMLCHPDKHSNSETATEVTKWLLEQREIYGKG